MAFNKSKSLENALKFLNQGKTAQAITEYQQILRHDAKDQATLMTVGDLFARQGDMKQAVEYFERLAQVYLNDGFNSKAIAIYKKIAKLAPAELAPLERLADLYVQQGVLSEARPLFLQIAESHLKANRAQKSVEVLHRLLDVEPENPRVQMRLAELYNVMGQKKEAAQTYYNYAQRLYDRSDAEEAQQLIERALEVDGNNPAALLLKAKILALTDKKDRAVAILEKHPEADGGGEVTNLLVDLDLKAGRNEIAADRARNQLVRGSSHSGLLLRVSDYVIEHGNPAEALPLLSELRDPLIETGEQEKFLSSLNKISEKLPGQSEPLEMMADFCRHTSDPFRLSAALSQLVDIYAAAGNSQRAEGLMLELIDRNKGDERLVSRLQKLRGQNGTPAGIQATEPAHPEAEARAEQPTQGEELREQAHAATRATPAVVEEFMDEETQRYIAQALTDVDLFSSYGLVQKAAHLLDNVLQRAPRHTPTLERLLDLQVGAGNERRTAELASQLEQIHRERGDTVNADRFSELRQRFQNLAGLTAGDLPRAPAIAQSDVLLAEATETPLADAAAEFAVTDETPAILEFEIPMKAMESEAESETAMPLVQASDAQPPARTEEVDLSDEWEAMVQEVVEPPTPEPQSEVTPELQIEATPEPQSEVTPELQIEATPEPQSEVTPELQIEATPEPQSEATPEPQSEVTPELQIEATPEPPIEVASEEEPIAEAVAEEPETAEVAALAPPAAEAEPMQIDSEATIELIDEEPETVLAEGPLDEPVEPMAQAEFELELLAEPTLDSDRKGAETTEDFLAELAAEVEDMETPAAQVEAAAPEALAASEEPTLDQVMASISGVEPAAEHLDQLAEVFQEFRSELGEIADEDEDLETHYNLGIAYREMGLLDEAIGEFQKVAKAIQKGRPFRYAMNCATLLALSFMDKGEPKIAAIWYQRALNTPGIDQETVLALRYDLGVALATAGESPAALDSFRQVYAMNIDYRDVADRIAVLQKV
jgi:pilus assembly protein FimV